MKYFKFISIPVILGLVIGSLALLPKQVLAAPTLIAHTTSLNTNNPNTTSPINITGATLIIVSTTQNGSNGSLVTPTDSTGDTFVLLGSQYQSGWYYILNPITSSSYTVSVPNGGGVVTLIVHAYSGVASYDTSNTSGLSESSGSITPANNGELLIADNNQDSANTPCNPTLSNGFTVIDNANLSCQHIAILANQVQTTAASINVTFSGLTNIGGGFLTGIAAFKAIPAGNATPIPVSNLTIFPTGNVTIKPGGNLTITTNN